MTGFFSTLMTRLGESEKDPPPWTPLDVTNCLSVLLVTFVLLGPLIAIGFLPDPQAQIVTAPMLGWVIGGVLTLVYVMLVMNRRAPGALRLGPVGLPWPFLMMVGLGVAIAIDTLALGVTGEFLPVPELLNSPFFDFWGWLLAAVFMIVAQSVAEEIVFRGIALPKFRVWFGNWPGLISTAALYAVFHLLVYAPNNTVYWYGFIAPLLAGIAMSAVRIHTDSTRAAVIFHAAFGLFAVLKALVLVA